MTFITTLHDFSTEDPINRSFLLLIRLLCALEHRDQCKHLWYHCKPTETMTKMKDNAWIDLLLYQKQAIDVHNCAHVPKTPDPRHI